jgi:hypothetical protein
MARKIRRMLLREELGLYGEAEAMDGPYLD